MFILLLTFCVVRGCFRADVFSAEKTSDRGGTTCLPAREELQKQKKAGLPQNETTIKRNETTLFRSFFCFCVLPGGSVVWASFQSFAHRPLRADRLRKNVKVPGLLMAFVFDRFCPLKCNEAKNFYAFNGKISKKRRKSAVPD